MGANLPRPTKIICVGWNYHAHAGELGSAVPAEPLIFFKPPSAIIGDGEAIEIPDGVGRVDQEAEIAVVIGRRARRVDVKEAAQCVAAYAPLNDVTARDVQRNDDQWTRAKGFDTFCPVGPPVAADAVDAGKLTIVARVNGVERQRGSIQQLAFGVPQLIAFISGIMTLEPGDIIATGTPAGVGPIQPGDSVEIELVGYSKVRNPVIARPA
ncbi:MAG: fumarylacetoacetate hydrolase family protein [Gemmatimonadetes bacterium]|nr:fumarylacetoacetate hydrolase family protein [Gemmatimonadota bacterium]